jgi:DNA-binding CsgD family transcriptional regulator
MSSLAQGREAYAERRWPDAVGQFTAAERDTELPAGDLEQLATSVILTGGPDGGDILARAHLKYLADGDYAAAARCAVWTGMNFMMQGEPARATGWIARAHRIIEDLPEPCPCEGLLFIPAGLGALHQGDGTAAAEAFTRASELGRQRGDADAAALGVLGLGQAKIMLGRLDDGLALLDEAMVAVTVGEISPIPAGIIYCAVIETCHLAFDLHRAHEWTRALDRWCEAQQHLVAFSGQCQMHRAELYRLHGAWSEAFDAAKTAQDLAFRGDRMATYGGFYEQGEIHRLRGDFDAAEAAYLNALGTGFPPQPGLALLRLAQGRPGQAQTLLRQAMDSLDPGYRRRMLAARVEVELAAGDGKAARAAMEELAALCATIDMPMLHALAEQSEASILFHDGDAEGALILLRRAWSRWLSLDAPFEAARCRALLAGLCAALGDEESARLEREAARAVFAELGAAPALLGLEQLGLEQLGFGQSTPVAPGATAPSAQAGAVPRSADDAGIHGAGPLTARETEVMRLVAAGLSNRGIATELFISEKTVARHLSNIFTKLGLTSRAAATAYAYRHGLA